MVRREDETMIRRTDMPIPTRKFAGLRRAVLAAIFFSLTALWGASKGPDAAGYVGTDATAYSFIDIATAGGGASVLANTDDGTAVVTMPFAFQFYGQTYTTVCVSSNGLLTFVANASACGGAPDFANTDLTVAGPPGDSAAILPLWSDLTFDAAGAGAVYYQTVAAADGRKFIVQWNNAYPLGSASPVTFQVVLSETSNQVLIQYKTVDLGGANAASNGGQATIGIRAASGNMTNRQIQWSYNAAVLANGMALLFTPSGAGAGVRNTITTNPPGLTVTIDGSPTATPSLVTWTPGSNHTLAVATPQALAGMKATATGWSTGAATASIAVQAPSTSTTYTAAFSTQYLLTTAVASGSGTVAASPTSADGYYTGGSTVQLTATPTGANQFTSWGGAVTGSTNPVSVTMNGPRSITATFAGAAQPTLLSVSTGFATFDFEKGAAYPAAQTIAVETAKPALVTLSGPTSAWLKAALSKSSAACSLILSVSPDGLASGHYSDVVTLSAPGAESVIVSVNLTVQDPPRLLTSTAPLSFQFTVGGTAPAAQSLSVVATVRNIDLAATASAAWISLGTVPAKTPAVLSVAVNIAGLAAGVYEGSIVLVSKDASNSPLTVPVKLTVAAAAVVLPTPAFTASGLVNGASFQPGPCAPGSLFTILGTNLASTTASAAGSPWPVSLGGTSVTINGVAVPLVYVSPTQINAQVPFEIPVGAVPVEVTAGGISSASVPMTVVAAAPGLFQSASGHAAVLNQDGSTNSSDSPSAAGSIVSAFLTGQGAVENEPATGAKAGSDRLSRTIQQVTAAIDGRAAAVSFAGLAPGLVGMLQVNLQVPDLAPGDRALVVTVGGSASNSALISIR
jgi:uncharacterized protein (TIGR03437 family)